MLLHKLLNMNKNIFNLNRFDQFSGQASLEGVPLCILQCLGSIVSTTL